jgi:hypothetical protein
MKRVMNRPETSEAWNTEEEEQAQENIKMDKLSTQNLNLIVNLLELKQICKSISALESIISPEWEYRYYSYQNDWSETEECCEMRNGQGDQMLIIFRVDGTVINRFAHESEMNGWADIVIEEKKSFFQKLFSAEKTPQLANIAGKTYLPQLENR